MMSITKLWITQINLLHIMVIIMLLKVMIIMMRMIITIMSNQLFLYI